MFQERGFTSAGLSRKKDMPVGLVHELIRELKMMIRCIGSIHASSALAAS